MTIATATLNQTPIGAVVYCAEGPETNKPDMRVQPGRLYRIDTPNSRSLEGPGVIERPCHQNLGTHPVEQHNRQCQMVVDSNLIRPAGEVISGIRGSAVLQFSYGRHEPREFVAITERGLVLLCVDYVDQRYEWRFPPEPLAGGLRFKDRAPITFGGKSRRGDFVIQSFSVMFDTTSSRTHYTDVEGVSVAFPIFSQVQQDFPGDAALIKGSLGAPPSV